MYGLVLEGGGARGSYQAGVYKAIKEMGIEIGGVAGSSIGALNGAMIIQGDYEEFYNLWSDVSYSMLFNIEKAEVDKMRNLTLSREDIKLIGDKAKQIISHGGIDITPIKKIIDKYIDEDKIRSTNKDFGIVTVNVSEFKPIEIFLEDIPKGHLKNYLLASAYLPFFKSERLDGDIYLDGGFYDNLPFKMLFEKGYKDLILVRTHAPGITRKIELRGTNSIVISPSEDIGRTYFYDSENTRKNIRLGYFDGMRAFNDLFGEKYFIRPSREEDVYLNYLLSIDENKVRMIENLLRLDELPYRRSLLEKIVPNLCDDFNIYKECTYEKLLIHLLEKSAAKYDIEKFKIYEFEELLSLVEKKIAEHKGDNRDDNMKLTRLGKFIDRVESIPMFNKEETLTDIADIIFEPQN